MSGPVREHDTDFVDESTGVVEVRPGRSVPLGGLDVVRVLPTKGRRTVGPWCFVDLMRPPDVDHPDPMEIGPHPHIGLATVTWLFSGEAEHTDSLGTVQLIRPGEINLMSSGRGIAHAELGLGPRLRGAQMWLAQPEATRHDPPAFEHHGDLPTVDLETGEAQLFIGEFGGESSPARRDSETLGADLRLRRGTVDIPLEPRHEHALAPIDAPVRVGDVVVHPGDLALVPLGRESIVVDVQTDEATVLLIGGEPLGENLFMWWNFVARSRDEVTEAWMAWEERDTDRYAPIPTDVAPMVTPRPPWLSPKASA